MKRKALIKEPQKYSVINCDEYSKANPAYLDNYIKEKSI